MKSKIALLFFIIVSLFRCSYFYQTSSSKYLISFVSGGEIYIINHDGSDFKQLTSSGGTSNKPSFSPDGTKIVFSRANVLSLIDINGGSIHELRDKNDNSIFCKDAEWSPDGTKIALISTSIIAIRYYNYNTKEIYNIKYGNYDSISWTGDSSLIIYELSSDFYRIYIDGSGEKLLLSIINDIKLIPNISGYVYSRNDFGSDYIFTRDINLKNEKQLTFSGNSHSPVFSPDSQKIVYVHNDGGGEKLWIMNADGSNQKPIPNLSTLLGAATHSAPDITIRY